MLSFHEWLAEARLPNIAPSIINSYEYAFKDQLRAVIARTKDPALRDELTKMIDCPIKDAKGQCRPFTQYILAALRKHGIHRRFDVEGVLGYIVEKMLMDVSDSGRPRQSVFGGFQERPGYEWGNPLQTRFLKYLSWAITNVAKGSIPRLSDDGDRLPGTISILPGSRGDGDAHGVSSSEIPSKSSGEDEYDEMLGDVESLLSKKERVTGLPLVKFFRATLSGSKTKEQAKQFGERKSDKMRAVLKRTLEEYGETTGNYALIRLMKRFNDLQAKHPEPAGWQKQSIFRNALPEKERDYASIMDVVDRFDRPVGSADLGKYRRRWLEYPARDASSGAKNRLEEVLGKMVKDGVLKTSPTRSGATVYSPGPHADAFRRPMTNASA